MKANGVIAEPTAGASILSIRACLLADISRSQLQTTRKSLEPIATGIDLAAPAARTRARAQPHVRTPMSAV